MREGILGLFATGINRLVRLITDLGRMLMNCMDAGGEGKAHLLDRRAVEHKQTEVIRKERCDGPENKDRDAECDGTSDAFSIAQGVPEIFALVGEEV